MFIEGADATTLRQGDIVADILFPLPRLDKKARLLGTFKQRTGQDFELEAVVEPMRKRPWLLAQIHVAIGPCAVVSQCCDVNRLQESPPPSFVLCRLVPVPEGIKKQAPLYEVLKQNVDPYGTVKPFIQLFHIGQHAPLDIDYVADYGQSMTVAWSDYDSILRKKILQMDDLNRAKFRVKAGAYFGRPTPEEIAAGTSDPWETPTAPTVTTQHFWGRLSRAYRVIRGKE